MGFRGWGLGFKALGFRVLLGSWCSDVAAQPSHYDRFRQKIKWATSYPFVTQGPKPLKAAQKAITLHTLGVQVGLSIHDDSRTRSSPTDSVNLERVFRV